MKKLLSSVVAVLCLVVSAVAQNAGTGAYPHATFDNRGFDSINIGNGNVRFSIPIVSRDGKGMPFVYAIQYDGLVWNATTNGSNTSWVPDPGWGFHGTLNGDLIFGYLSSRTTYRGCPRPPNYSKNVPPAQVDTFSYHDAFGGIHPFNYKIDSGCPLTPGDEGGTSGDGKATDQSGYVLLDTSHVRASNGVVFVPSQSSAGGTSTQKIDPNGNQISSNGNGSFTDTLGVVALTVTGSSTKSLSYPVTLQTSNATSAAATITYGAHTVQTNFQSSVIDYPATSVNLIDAITLADGSAYSFTYEPTQGGVSGAVTGRIHSVTLPTGGVITYTYSAGVNGLLMYNDGTPAVLTRTTSDGTRTYTRGGNGPIPYTVVVDEIGNETDHDFVRGGDSGQFWYEAGQWVNVGNGSGRTLLQDTQTCFNGASAPCREQSFTLPIVQKDVTVSFNGTSPAKTTYTYDSNNRLSSTIDAGGTTTTLQYDSFGNVTDSTTRDSASNVVAHTYASFDGKGNQTESHVATGSQVLDTFYGLNADGTVNTSENKVNSSLSQGTTTYAYNSSTHQLLTGATLPTPSSGVTQSTTSSVDLNAAVVKSSTDANSLTTTINNYDARLRPTKITLPSGSVITQARVSNVISRQSQTLDAKRTMLKDTLVDGYGRVIRQGIHNTNPAFGNDWNRVDYCYNATGLLSFKSTPYQGNGVNYDSIHCSGAGTSYSYDALGRVTGVTLAEGTAKTEYSGRAVRTTSILGLQKITQYDVLGRLSSICEVSSNAMAGVSPTACATDFGGSIQGFVTTYAYNLVNHTTSVTQGQQVRVFQTDAAGRTTSVTEPERSAPTTYSYAYNSTGLSVTRTRPKANQSNAGVKTNTTTQYDLLGRVITVTYDDGLTPNKAFYYDTMTTVFGTSHNVKGLLAATSSAGAVSQYDYDAAGNMTTLWQCAPSTCGSNANVRGAITMGYDTAGALLNITAGAAGSITYGRSITEEVTSVTNNTYTDPTNTPALVSNVVNGALGITNWHFGNNTSDVRQFDSMGRVSGSWLCSGTGADGQSAGCANNSQMYAYLTAYTGSVVTNQIDTVMHDQGNHYDAMGRLDFYSGCCTQAFYSYDRFGNRMEAGSASLSFSFDPLTNHNTSFGYDAAGNQTNDAIHQYTYDAEGKVLMVDSGSTAQYTYDALDQRIRVQKASGTFEYMFDAQGRRISTWQLNGTPSGAGNEARIYWDYGLLAHRAQDGTTYFHHSDWLGTDRVRTDHNGTIVDTLLSDGFGGNPSQSSTNTAGAAQDNNQYTGQEFDSETATNHFQFRQYSPVQGRWMSPDPYSGSYDFSNPQSFNRYSYALNNPYSLVDPLGLSAESCDPGDDFNNDGCGVYEGGISSAGGGGGSPDPCASDPSCVTVTAGPDPAPPSPPPIDPCLGVVCYVYFPGSGSSVGSGGGGAVQTGAPSNGIGQQIQLDPYKKRLFDTHYCGPGGDGPTVNKLDEACAAHDACYDNRGFGPSSNFDPFLSPRRTRLLQDCNQRLCNATTGPADQDRGSGLVRLYFTQVPLAGAACH